MATNDSMKNVLIAMRLVNLHVLHSMIGDLSPTKRCQEVATGLNLHRNQLTAQDLNHDRHSVQ